MTLQPGQTLGRYQILEMLGSGGMATVYKAYQPALDRLVALKVIRPGFAEDAEFRERFEREARAIARLAHPNIVQVFDYDQVEGRSFLALQYLEGGTLKDRLSRLVAEGRPPLQAEVARIVHQAADALAYAHSRGIVHRDVKPSNIMLTEDGRAVVTDFGIAKIVGGTQLTQTGVGIGTPEYMSPEQGQGGDLDARSDIYSLGVVAYELLTGTLPFTADTPFAVVLKHVRDPLPLPSTRDPAVGPATERALLRALAKEPAARYATASDFAAELERAVNGDRLGTVATLPIERGRAEVARAEALGRPPASQARRWPRRVAVLLLLAAAASLLLFVVAPASRTSFGPFEGLVVSRYTAIAVGRLPTALAVNSNTDRIYVVNQGSGTISVIDGASNAVVATVGVGPKPSGIAINLRTDRIYVVDDSGSLSVIDGASNVVVATVQLGPHAFGGVSVAVNPVTNRIFVGGSGVDRLSVLDGASNRVLSTIAVDDPERIAVNPVTNRVYVTHGVYRDLVTVVDVARNAVVASIPGIKDAYGVTVDPLTNRIYVQHQALDDRISVIDGTSNAVSTVSVEGPESLAIHPSIKRIYVVSGYRKTLVVIDGATNAVTATLPLRGIIDQQGRVGAVDVNTLTHRVYVTNLDSNSVSVIG